MTVVADKVFNAALSLPSDARVTLVEKLLASLNLPTHASVPVRDYLSNKKQQRSYHRGC